MTEKGQGKYYVFALRAAANITGTILVPAVAAAFAGRYLDTRFGTGKTWFAVLLSVAFFFTVVVLIRKIRSYGHAYQKLAAEPRDGAARS